MGRRACQGEGSGERVDHAGIRRFATEGTSFRRRAPVNSPERRGRDGRRAPFRPDAPDFSPGRDLAQPRDPRMRHDDGRARSAPEGRAPSIPHSGRTAPAPGPRLGDEVSGPASRCPSRSRRRSRSQSRYPSRARHRSRHRAEPRSPPHRTTSFRRIRENITCECLAITDNRTKDRRRRLLRHGDCHAASGRRRPRIRRRVSDIGGEPFERRRRTGGGRT